MDETIKKDVIAREMTEMECYTECYPVIQEEVAIQEYTKVPLGQLSALRRRADCREIPNGDAQKWYCSSGNLV